MDMDDYFLSNVTTRSNPHTKQALLDAARKLKQALRVRIEQNRKESEAQAVYKAASTEYSQSYKAWEEATVKAAALKIKVPLLQAASEAAHEASWAQHQKVQEAARKLWRACGVSGDMEILDAATVYASETKQKERLRERARQAEREFCDAREELNTACTAQSDEHERHEDARAALQAADDPLKELREKHAGPIGPSIYSGHVCRRDLLIEAEIEVTKAACEFAGGATDGHFFPHSETADSILPTPADWQCLLTENAENLASRTEGYSWTDIIAAVESARPSGASRPLTSDEWGPVIDSILPTTPDTQQ